VSVQAEYARSTGSRGAKAGIPANPAANSAGPTKEAGDDTSKAVGTCGDSKDGVTIVIMILVTESYQVTKDGIPAQPAANSAGPTIEAGDDTSKAVGTRGKRDHRWGLWCSRTV
jgi:hypothetical protein